MKTANNQTAKKTPVKIIVKREFVGTQSLAEAFIPVICEDIRRILRTMDDADMSA